MTQPQLTDDKKANELLLRINRHIVAKELIRERILQLERKLVFRDQRIRELAKQRTEVLNFTLPL